MQLITCDQEAPAIPFFSFDDAGMPSIVASFAADWGDAQAAQDWHAGSITDAGDLDGQGALEARVLLVRGAARTDDSPAFVQAFSHAWADGYAARIVFAEARGW